FHGEPSELVTAHTHGEHSDEGARSMLLPVGVLALGATFVGFLAIPGVWEPFEKWLEPVVPPLVQATTAQDWFSSLISVALASLGIFVAWRAFQARRELVPDGFARTALEHKLWFDELYDVGVSRPAPRLPVPLRARRLAPGPARRDAPARPRRGAGRPGWPRRGCRGRRSRRRGDRERPE